MRRRGGGGEHRRDHPLLEDPAVRVSDLAKGLCVPLREPGHVLDGALEVPAAHEGPAVREHVRELVFGPHVPGAVALQLQVPVDRTHVDDAVEVGVEVVAEPRRGHLLGGAPAAHHVAGLEQ